MRTSETSIQLLDRGRDALADADAHGAERDRAAMRIDEIGVVLDPELTQAGDALAGKGFIELDQIKIADLQAQPFHQLARRRHRTDTHDARRHRGRGEAKNARARRQPVLSYGSL